MGIDLGSLSIGVVIGTAIGALINGFFKKMGEDAYTAAKGIVKQEIKFVEVVRRYDADCTDGAALAWVSEARLYECQNLGYTYRTIDNQNNGCYRITHDGRTTYKEYLMIKPK